MPSRKLCAASEIAVESFDSSIWKDSFEIFAPIQASEAAAVHAGYFDHFEPAIAERWPGARRSPRTSCAGCGAAIEEFRDAYDRLFDSYDFLILPCAPVSALAVGADHSEARSKILRYTSPASLAGTPVVAIPLDGAGVQLIGRHGSDAALVAFAAYPLARSCRQ